MKHIQVVDLRESLKGIDICEFSNASVAPALESDDSKEFSSRLFELLPEGHTESHSHAHEQLHYILEGTGKGVIDGRDVPLKEGDILLVNGHEEHQFFNTSSAPFRFLVFFSSHGKPRV